MRTPCRIHIRLRKIREEMFGPRGQAEFAKKLGVLPQSYSRYERGRQPSIDFLCALQKVLKININWLLTGEGDKYLNRSRSQGVETIAEGEATFREKSERIPVLESVGAGAPKDINEVQPAEYITLDNAFATPGMVALRVNGNSMETDIPDGSIVGVDVRKESLRELKTRKIYVIWIRHEGLIIRRLYRDGKNLSFLPDNPLENNRPYIYTWLTKERRYTPDAPVINGVVRWVLNRFDH